jgi:hypothetical protein
MAFVATGRGASRGMQVDMLGWRDRRFGFDDVVIAMAFTRRLNGNIETLHLWFETTSILDNMMRLKVYCNGN